MKDKCDGVDWVQLAIFFLSLAFFTGIAYGVLSAHDKRISKCEKVCEDAALTNYKLDLILGHFNIKFDLKENARNND